MEEVRTRNFIEEAIEEDLARMRREDPQTEPVSRPVFLRNPMAISISATPRL